VRATVVTRLIEISATGARIEHGNLLRPGVACVLELPGSFGGMALAARVVRTIEIEGAAGDAVSATLRYESGLRFEYLSPEQQIVLDGVLERYSQRSVVRGQRSA
jgi:PilZ domain